MMFRIIIATLLAFAAADDAILAEETKEEQFKYVKPEIGDLAHHLAESFHNLEDFKQSWVLSQAKKDGVEAEIAKYDGKWILDEPKENALEGDLGLVLKSEAKHAAISAKLASTFNFNNEPLIIQYEVKFQKAQECGGAYIKLLADKEGMSLEEFGDKTLYSIMFGPDKCGHDGKMHFILQHENPISGKMVEHHAKPPSGDFKTMFDDKKSHLVTLVVRPGNTFDILLDNKIINSGSLLKDMTPPINPEKEIDDPSDSKPAEWDEREKIPEPTATKPDDWDEDAPKKIVDEQAVKPEAWVDDAPENVPDPESERPADWDTEEDGEWEAPLIPNPKCTGGLCGEWKRPSIDNPAYKGKWVPALISNPDYKGIWAPRKIANPDFFEDNNPFINLKAISAVGFELWSMQSDITFDNIILATEQSTVDTWTKQTWDLKILKEAASAPPSAAKSMFDSVIQATEDKPWLWAIYIIVILLPFVLIYTFCFPSKDKSGDRKKTDEPSPDDEPGDDEVSNRSVDTTDDELPEAEDVAKPTETAKAEPEPVKVEQEADSPCEGGDEAAAVVEEVAEDEPVVVEDAAEPAAAAQEAQDAPEPITNGHAEEAESEDDSPAPSPRATRSKKKTRKDT